jgi:hypothetical protein
MSRRYKDSQKPNSSIIKAVFRDSSLLINNIHVYTHPRTPFIPLSTPPHRHRHPSWPSPRPIPHNPPLYRSLRHRIPLHLNNPIQSRCFNHVHVVAFLLYHFPKLLLPGVCHPRIILPSHKRPCRLSIYTARNTQRRSRSPTLFLSLIPVLSTAHVIQCLQGMCPRRWTLPQTWTLHYPFTVSRFQQELFFVHVAVWSLMLSLKNDRLISCSIPFIQI